MRSRKSSRRRASSSFVDNRKPRLSSTVRDSAAANGSAIETAGEIFSDGTIIEILRDPASLEGFSLVRSQRGVDLKSPVTPGVCRQFAWSECLESVRFPTQVAPPESKLFTDVHALLHRYLAQLDPCITAMVFRFMRVDVTVCQYPILCDLCPSGSPKISRCRSCMLCRRPLRPSGLQAWNDIPRVPTPAFKAGRRTRLSTASSDTAAR